MAMKNHKTKRRKYVKFQKSLKEHLKTFDENYMRDFMDVFIKEMNRDKTGYFTGMGVKILSANKSVFLILEF
jgi:hypothetical protein